MQKNAVAVFLELRLRFHVCELFIRQTLSVRLLSVSQNRIKRFLMLVFQYVRISVRKNKRTDKVRMYRSAQEESFFFFFFFSRSLREQKFSNANFRGENSARSRVSSRRQCFPPRDFAEKLRENSRRNSANFHRVSPRRFAQILRENSESFKKKNVNSLNFCFVWFVVLRPSQQLWSCRDDKLTMNSLREGMLPDPRIDPATVRSRFAF